MDAQEKAALRANHLAILEDLDVKNVAPVLYQNNMLDDDQYEEICESRLSRRKLCQLFLLKIKKPNSKCTFQGLLAALRYDGMYTFLSEKLHASLRKTEKSDCKRTESSTAAHDKPYDTITKIDVFTTRRKKMVRIAYELKHLSHDGQTERFETLISMIHQKYYRNKLCASRSIAEKTELADMHFTALEAEASAKRERYDTTVCGSSLFTDMNSVIPYTSDPHVTSMTYLARFGSSVGMSDGVDCGLALLQYAKQHAECVAPCKDTGMIYYIELNFLFQKFEATPCRDLKEKVLQTAHHAISHFESETKDMRIDYQRMLMLKMVFCYLGMGLFGKRIPTIETAVSDRDEAKRCLDFIEKPDVWKGMEKRRKMLFHLAKAEYHRQSHSYDLADVHAKRSRKLARKNRWTGELANIEELVKEIEDSECDNYTATESVDFVESVIADIEESDIEML